MSENNVKQNNEEIEVEEEEEEVIEDEPTYAQQIESSVSGPSAPLIFQFIKNRGFDLKEKIGSGQYSTVYKASWAQMPGHDIACKRIELDEVDPEWRERCLERELNIIRKLKHKNIIEIYEVIKTRKLVFIFMQMAANGSIEKYMTKAKHPIRESQAKIWFSDLMAGLSYMHSKGVAHRDLKLDNFLLDHNYSALLSDFGFAVIDETNGQRMVSETMCGSPIYMAPEVHSARKGSPYDPKTADLYSMGVCLFQMINYDKPFDTVLATDNLAKLVQLKRDRSYRFHSKIDAILSPDIKDLIFRLLEPNPLKRIQTQQICRHKALH